MSDINKRTTRYDREPHADLVFIDSKSHYFCHPLDQKSAQYIEFSLQHAKRGSRPFSPDWLESAFLAALDPSDTQTWDDLILKDVRYPLEELLSLVAKTLRNDLEYSGDEVSYFEIIHGLREAERRVLHALSNRHA